jgi:hypothetical protein
MVVMAARCIVATSDNRGCPCHQSCPMVVAFLCYYITFFSIIQSTFLLSLKVTGPGGSLSILLPLRHTGETPIGLCPGRRNCDRCRKL